MVSTGQKMGLHHTDWKIHLKMSFHLTENSYHYEKYLRNGKNNFCQLQNQFPQARIKKILLLLHRKPVPTSQSEEFIKKYVSTCRKSCFHSQEYLANRKKLFFTSQKDSFFQEQGCFSLKIGLQASIMVSTSKNSE